MNGLERRLIELNNRLYDLIQGPISQTTQTTIQVSAQAAGVPDNDDTIIINNIEDECDECPPGPRGYTGSVGYTGSAGETGLRGPTGYTGSQGSSGSAGEQGPPGEPGPIGFTGSAGICNVQCNAILVTANYTVQTNDYYIGVNSSGPTTITLPANCTTCQELIIKAEMGPPLGNRKVTIATTDGSTIDGDNSYIIEVPYQSVNLLCRGGNWHII